MLWKCKVPDKSFLASYLIGWVNLRPELQDKLYLTCIVGDNAAALDGFKCTFKNKK